MPPITLSALLPISLFTLIAWRIVNPLPSSSSSRHSRFAAAAPETAARLRGDVPPPSAKRRISSYMGPTSVILSEVVARGKSGGAKGHRRHGSTPGRMQSGGRHRRNGSLGGERR